MESEVEQLRKELEKYKQIDSEWLRAARKYLCSVDANQQEEGLRELDELRIGNSWTEMTGEPVLKVITEQRDKALKKVKFLTDGLKVLCLLWDNYAPVAELKQLLTEVEE